MAAEHARSLERFQLGAGWTFALVDGAGGLSRPLAMIVRFATVGLVLFALAAGCKKNSAPASQRDEAQRNFAMVCGRCHGPDGRGGVAMGLPSAPPNLRDPKFQESRTDAQLRQVIVDGKGAMPAF